jgi:hypothetical protein
MTELRISPRRITSLEKDEIFVFGSNIDGFHGDGAAYTALGWDALWGRSRYTSFIFNNIRAIYRAT